MAKARQFVEAAETVEALADDANDVAHAYVTLGVHAGIAAADVICCERLGEHSRGEDHTAAVALVGRASETAAKNLRDLLSMKTKAGYSAVPASGTDYKRAGRAARALVEEAVGPDPVSPDHTTLDTITPGRDSDRVSVNSRNTGQAEEG